MAENRHTPGPDGCPSLRELGIDHYHFDDWEMTYDGDDLERIDEELGVFGQPVTVETLIRGPTLYAAGIPVEFDENGDVDRYETRFFNSREEALSAIAKATGGDK